jgi:N-acetylglutamate synthase-like GNAT family acetyltransferase
MNVEIAEARTDAEIAACHPVVVQLRPHLSSLDEFIARVRGQMGEGYHLAALRRDGKVMAVAGYRFARNLAWGRFMYVDDLVTACEARDAGAGSRLMEWLIAEARAAGCEQFHLDSGVQRFAAHGFYLKHRLAITSHHFARVL